MMSSAGVYGPTEAWIWNAKFVWLDGFAWNALIVIVFFQWICVHELGYIVNVWSCTKDSSFQRSYQIWNVCGSAPCHHLNHVALFLKRCPASKQTQDVLPLNEMTPGDPNSRHKDVIPKRCSSVDSPSSCFAGVITVITLITLPFLHVTFFKTLPRCNHWRTSWLVKSTWRRRGWIGLPFVLSTSMDP